jgi:hypothetical protein
MKKIVLLCGILAAITVSVVGCKKDQDQPDVLNEKVNSNCTVYFSRAALGGTSTNIVPVETNSINGAQVSLSGKLIKVTPEWIVLEYHPNNNLKMKRNAWIPRGVVLWVRTE